MTGPGVDPDVVGGAGEETIKDAVGRGEAIEELQIDVADGA